MGTDPTMRRDPRQFKGAPYQDQKQFPPPSAKTWESIGVTPPGKTLVGRTNRPGSAKRKKGRR